jgi:hypothetical protein
MIGHHLGVTVQPRRIGKWRKGLDELRHDLHDEGLVTLFERAAVAVLLETVRTDGARQITAAFVTEARM